MSVPSTRVLSAVALALLSLAFSQPAAAQNFVPLSPYAYGAGPIVAPYVAPVPATYVRSVTVARYPVTAGPLVAPAPVVAVPYYAARPALVRPVIVRPKYYVPYQPIRNTVRAITP